MTNGCGLLIDDLLFVEQAAQGLDKKSVWNRGEVSMSAPQPSKVPAGKGDEWLSLTRGQGSLTRGQ